MVTSMNSLDQIRKALKNTVNFLPHCPKLLEALGSFCSFHPGLHELARQFFVKACFQADETQFLRCQICLDSLLSFGISLPTIAQTGCLNVASNLFGRLKSLTPKTHVMDAWHMETLNYLGRNRRFMEAIENCVHPGSTVLDIGTGSSILALCAAKCGARVYACEMNEVLCSIGKQIIEANGYAHSIAIYPEISFELELDDRVDVIVSETLDCCIFGEGILHHFIDAHERLSIRNPICIPYKASLYVAIVECPSLYAEHTLSLGDRCYIVSGSVNTSPLSTTTDFVERGYLSEPYGSFHPEQHSSDLRYLSDWKPIVSVCFADKNELLKIAEHYRESEVITVKEEGTAHCVIAHFRAVLRDGGEVEDSSVSGSSWPLAVWPLPLPLSVDKDQQLTISYGLERTAKSEHARQMTIVVDDVWKWEETNRPPCVISAPELDFSSNNDHRLISFYIDSMRAIGNVLVVNDWTQLIGVTYRLAHLNYSGDLNIPIHTCVPCSELWCVYREWSNSRCKVEIECVPQIHESQEDQDQSFEVPRTVVLHFPLDNDGTIHKERFEQVTDCLASPRDTWSSDVLFIPSRLTAFARIVESDYLHMRCRPVHSSHLGFNLSKLDDYSLPEYKNIPQGTAYTQMSAPFQMASHTFRLYPSNFNVDVKSTPNLSQFSTSFSLRMLRDGNVDAVMYYWNMDSFSMSHRYAALPFPKRLAVKEGDTLKFSVGVLDSVFAMYGVEVVARDQDNHVE